MRRRVLLQDTVRLGGNLVPRYIIRRYVAKVSQGTSVCTSMTLLEVLNKLKEAQITDTMISLFMSWNHAN